MKRILGNGGCLSKSVRGCVAIVATLLLCSVTATLAIELGIAPDVSATKTAEFLTSAPTLTAEYRAMVVAENRQRTSEAATATIIALTPSSTPSPTFTPSVTPLPSVTDTPLPTRTPTNQPTARPEIRYATSNVNLRSCTGTQCAVVGSLAFAEDFRITGSSEDQNGDTWYSLKHEDKTVWVAGWLTSTSKPAARPVQQPQQDQVEAVPQQPMPAQPTEPAPQSTQPPAPAAPSFACDCSKTCPAMTSCEEAYFQLNQCGCGRRDGDNDGVPCEEICPGG